MLVTVDDLALCIDNNRLFGGLNLKLDVGERIGLTGRSGTGKSALLQVLLHTSTGKKLPWICSGRVKVCSTPIGYLPQQPIFPSLFPCGFVLQRAFQYVPKTRKDSALRLYEALVPKQFHSRSIDGLSGGERQRASLTLSAFFADQLLIIDEPFTGLDATTKEEMLVQFNNFVRENNLALIVVSHDLELLLQSAEIIYQLRNTKKDCLSKILIQGNEINSGNCCVGNQRLEILRNALKD